jgi:hypothetical protein
LSTPFAEVGEGGVDAAFKRGRQSIAARDYKQPGKRFDVLGGGAYNCRKLT